MTEQVTDVKSVKCVVWDLDQTIWDGVLLEDGDVRLRPGVRQVLEVLDERGILHSLASRNDPEAVRAKLEEFGIDHYFLHPQIGWHVKSESVGRIAEALNIGTDAIAFVDDQPFERDEVVHEHPDVLCVDAAELTDLLVRPEFIPRFVTEDSKRRREMYREDARRKIDEKSFAGPQETFLAGLDMRFEIAEAGEGDLQRAEELTVRTNQLNTTGRTFSYDELDAFRRSDDHLLLVARLTDRYGPYGNIGLALMDTSGPGWTIRLLLMSCRVMSRGVGTVLINHIKRRAASAGVQLSADFISTGRNRPMLVSFKFNGFSEVARDGAYVTFRADLTAIPPDPDYIKILVS
ncbi:HAD family hydrolase [Saccharopolyspora gloriosae]|uniref:HAD-IIIC family phosphatase n=1 Tax=Saccharopolyspora gloriosae TaxID=455344 RepID=UPI001FB85593|nr:HAD-IIIC family phosphatase [Saccharopolyspora gloriosae]